MPLSCPESAQLAHFVGRSPWTAADALVGSLGFDEAHFATEERDQGDPRGPGGLPHNCMRMPSFQKTKWHWVDNLPRLACTTRGRACGEPASRPAWRAFSRPGFVSRPA
jgi:hypothetical protein